MNKHDKTHYTKIALALVGISVNEMTAELIWKVVDGINEKKGEFNLKDAIEIEIEVQGKWTPKKVTVSEEVIKTKKKED